MAQLIKEEAYMKFALHFALLFLAFTFPASAHEIEYDTGALVPHLGGSDADAH